jgi:dTDP-4-dehydrorhamnose reductase
MLNKVLVTGSNGQVGRCLVEQLDSLDDVELLAVDREQLDITSQRAVDDLVSTFQPNFIINAAAHTAVDKAEEEVELSYAINEQGPKFLAEAAKRIDSAILHISTDYVFEGNKEGEYRESDLTNPQGIYGKSKLAGEIAVAQSCDKHIILRTAWVFGEYGNNFVKTMLRLGKERGELSIVGDQFGGPTYAGDIARTLIQIMNRIRKNDIPEFGIYHYSGLPHVSWFDFANTIFDVAVEKKVLAKKPYLTSITSDQYPTLAKRPGNSCLSNEKVITGFSVEASNWKCALNNIQTYTG